MKNNIKRSNSRLDFKIGNEYIVKSKRSQVTIFIIIGIIIVAAIIGFFLLYYKTEIRILKPSITEPQQYIDKCVRDATYEAIDIMLPQGGYLNPGNYKLYNDTKIAYLCYTNLFYKSCVMREPMYIEHLQDEITDYITPKVETCFQTLKLELERENYKVVMEEMNLTTKLAMHSVEINMDRKVEIGKQGETRKFENFKSYLNSPLYDLAIVAQEIASQEAKFCYFEYVGFMALYPEFSIDKKQFGEGEGASKIYFIIDRNSEKKLSVAIRSCAVPAGF